MRKAADYLEGKIMQDLKDKSIEELEEMAEKWREYAGQEPEPIKDKQDGKHFVWGTAADLTESEQYEKFIQDNAKPLLGLPEEIKLLPGDCVGISAPTGSGKTTSLIGIAVQNLNAGKKVAMIILEETEMETKHRIIKQLKNKMDIVNLAILEVVDFRESTFENDLYRITMGQGIDVLLVDYINDTFLTFDKTNGLAAFEKIKYTVAKLAAFNHKTLKSRLIIGVQGTIGLLTAEKDKILSNGKAYFEGGQSTIKPLQYAILIKDNDGGDFEKNAYIVKARNVLVGGSIALATYGLVYIRDSYEFHLLGNLKDIVRTEKRNKEENREIRKAERAAAKDKPKGVAIK